MWKGEGLFRIGIELTYLLDQGIVSRQIPSDGQLWMHLLAYCHSGVRLENRQGLQEKNQFGINEQLILQGSNVRIAQFPDVDIVDDSRVSDQDRLESLDF